MGYGVLDQEKSVCGDCVRFKVCRIVKRIEDAYDVLVDFKLVMTECKAYLKVEDNAESKERREGSAA